MDPQQDNTIAATCQSQGSPDSGICCFSVYFTRDDHLKIDIVLTETNSWDHILI